MPVSVRPIGQSPITDSDQLIKIIREVLKDLEDQLNERTDIFSSTDGRIPGGLTRGDLVILTFKGIFKILLKTRTGFDELIASHLGGLMAKGTNFIGITTSAAAPAVADYPKPNDWGFHSRTGGTPNFYLAFNFGGSVRSIAMP